MSIGHHVGLTGRVEGGLVLVSEVDEDIARLKHLHRLVGEGGRTAGLSLVKGLSEKRAQSERGARQINRKSRKSEEYC